MSERFGQYELIEKIAAGGMAEIFFGRLVGVQGFARNVVVKRMLPELSVRPDFVEMFLDEARLAANLNHPNLVQVYDLGEVDRAYFMAMEFIDGPHLGSLFAHSLRQKSPLPLNLCAWIVARAADGLNFAHDATHPDTGEEMNIVHRDISPQNILISKYGDVKVTDFGVAKTEVQHTKTRTGVIKGKVAYMSPEQCLAEQVDRRTDVFALGICLYELLTRRRLYKEKSDLQIMTRITQEAARPPSELNASVDKSLSDICLKALAKNVEERYQNMAEFAMALDQWLLSNQHMQGKKSLAAWIKEKAPDIGPSIKKRKRGTGESSGLSGQWAQPSEAPPLGHTPATGTQNVPGAFSTPETDRFSDVETLGNTNTYESGTFEVSTGKTEIVSTDMIVAEQSEGPSTNLFNIETSADTRLATHTTVKQGRAAQLITILFIFLALLGGFVFWQMNHAASPQGSLRVSTVPSKVPLWIDGIAAGKTPFYGRVKAGEIKVGIAFPDEPLREKKVTVQPNLESGLEVLGLVPLQVKTDQKGALVYVDGSLKGETPLTSGVRLPPKVKTKIEVKKDGYEVIQKTVEPAPGAPFVINLTLQKKRKSSSPKVRSLNKPKRVGSTNDGNKAKMASALNKVNSTQAQPDMTSTSMGIGFLTLKTNPWTTVRIGNRILGETPVIKKKLKAGRHVLQLSNPERGIAMDLAVNIIEGEVLTKTVRINTGKINFSALPPGVDVKVDGKTLGTTPLGNLTAYPGSHAVEIKSNGVTRKVIIKVKPGATVSVE